MANGADARLRFEYFESYHGAVPKRSETLEKLRARRPRIVTWLLVPVLVYGGICLLAFLLQDKLLYFPTAELAVDPGAAGLKFEDVELEIEGAETRVHAWFVPHPAPRGTVIWCHGNAGNISHRVSEVQRLHGLRLQTLIFDYPGYGKSTGSPSEPALYAAAERCWAHLVEERGIAAARIVIWGRSLGGTVAVDLASRHRAAALIVESSMTSVLDVARRHYFWLPVSLLLRSRFEAVRKIGDISIPKLCVHSPQDEVVPYELGRLLFDTASEPKEFLEVRGGHNDERGARYSSGILRFLDRVLGEGS